MSGWPPSGRTRKKKLRDLEDIVEDSMEAPFSALEDMFVSLGNLFEDDSDLNSNGTSGLRPDMEKLKADLHKMKHDLERGKKSMHVPAEPVMPSNVPMSSGGATFSIGNTGKKHKHYMKLKDEEGNFVEVTFNDSSDLSIRTEGDLDSALMEEVKRHVRLQLEDKEPNVLNTKETYVVEEPTRQRPPMFWSRTWRGERKDPLDFTPESKVSVSGPSMLNRKYNVEVDGVTVFMRKIEATMERRHQAGGEALGIFVKTLTDDEKVIMQKIFDGLKDLDYIEEHHIAAQDLL